MNVSKHWHLLWKIWGHGFTGKYDFKLESLVNFKHPSLFVWNIDEKVNYSKPTCFESNEAIEKYTSLFVRSIDEKEKSFTNSYLLWKKFQNIFVIKSQNELTLYFPNMIKKGKKL
jgi:hypothetical protein